MIDSTPATADPPAKKRRNCKPRKTDDDRKSERITLRFRPSDAYMIRYQAMRTNQTIQDLICNTLMAAAIKERWLQDL